jgi:hypothetical protein
VPSTGPLRRFDIKRTLGSGAQYGANQANAWERGPIWSEPSERLGAGPNMERTKRTLGSGAQSVGLNLPGELDDQTRARIGYLQGGWSWSDDASEARSFG